MQAEVVEGLGEVRHVGLDPGPLPWEAPAQPHSNELELLGPGQDQGTQRCQVALQSPAGHLSPHTHHVSKLAGSSSLRSAQA